jgi:hypothetical protein
MAAYSEHVGWKRQALCAPAAECTTGETTHL